ncbi:RNA polymerase sigma factor [Streptomyces bambusae]|uniref:Sigma-70 family RNA polymerase sigma factor n=1 Tax=Streptomyces bambusae TaxID=1550616 RepID=A0ABS6Z0A9_9ACTN|nr:sigma-70 family RNA polymerase sigma factor [Streptomyces bambusae]MBW5481147.1 sigma-70 family RNA polymerase sigma factor [Streptomyces bambusae]
MAPTPEEFAHFFNHWDRQVRRYLIWLEGDLSLIDDAAQDTMIAAHRYWNRLSGLENKKAWLFRIAGQRLSRLRQARQRQGVITDPRELPDHRMTSDAMARKVEQLAVLDAVRKLPQQQATAMALQLQFDHPLSEIAEIMGISTGSVKTHLHHARATLKTLLADVDGGA